MIELKAPFPYFGGKSRVANLVWERFGSVDLYVEPFAGSLAVLFGRPVVGHYDEIVNDKDMYIANFWRAVKGSPEEVAMWADWPINEADVHARHYWLISEGRSRIANINANPDLYDTQVAGWWVWGQSLWIGSGWCRGDGAWEVRDGVLVKRSGLPDDAGGICLARPHVTGVMGINGGIARQMPRPDSNGISSRGITEVGLGNYMTLLSERLRNVIVMCGDWKRTVTFGVTSRAKITGIFLDPPYSLDTGRKENLYGSDIDNDSTVSGEVLAWCLEHGNNPDYRIALCGYDSEYELPGWEVHSWSAGTPFRSRAQRDAGTADGNRHLERIWFSPHCSSRGMTLFDGVEDAS